VLWRPIQLSLRTCGPLVGALMKLHNYIFDSPHEDTTLARASDDVSDWVPSTEKFQGGPGVFTARDRTTSKRRVQLTCMINSAGLRRPPLHYVHDTTPIRDEKTQQPTEKMTYL